MPGGLALIDLPPGTSAVAEFRFRDSVRLGARGRHFAIDVTGGLGGLVVDLRDVPLRLPDRADLRGELLESWQTAIVTGRRRVSADDVRLVPGPAARRRRRSTPSSRWPRATGRSSRPAIRSSSAPRSPSGCATPGSTRWRSRRRPSRSPASAGSACRDAATSRAPGGEFVFDWHGRWRVATGDIADPIESPFAGIVRDVRPGTGITIRAAGRGIRGHRRARRTDARPAPGRCRRASCVRAASTSARPARSSSSARGWMPRR